MKNGFLLLAMASSIALSAPTKKIMLTFPGMGTTFGWSFGVLHAAYEAFPAVRQNNVILTANSGGGVPALFFACHGISEESIRQAEKFVRNFPPDVVNEATYSKLFQIAMGLATEYDNKGLIETIKEVIPENCVPKFPVAVVAGNAEVNERRLYQWPKTIAEAIAQRFKRKTPRNIVGTKAPNSDVVDLRLRYFNPLTYTVFEKVHERAQPTPVGQGCTYWLSADLFEQAKKIPEGVRLCDLRLITNARQALLAMVSEATQSFPVREGVNYFGKPEPTQHELIQRGELMISDAQMKRAPFVREYNGGIIMPGSVVRDIVTLYPDIQIISSGRPFYYDETVKKAVRFTDSMKDKMRMFSGELADYLEENVDSEGDRYWTLPADGKALYLRAWYGFDVNQLVYLDQGITDVVVPVPNQLMEASNPTGAARKGQLMKEVIAGYEAARNCFSKDGLKNCPPPRSESIPELTAQSERGKRENPVPDWELPKENRRKKGWRPNLNFEIEPVEIEKPQKG